MYLSVCVVNGKPDSVLYKLSQKLAGPDDDDDAICRSETEKIKLIRFLTDIPA
jgi:hypothetical protein